MNAPSAHAGLEQALELSRRMLEQARQGHWDEVGELDRERGRLLAAGYPADARSRDALAAMLEHNSQLLAQAEAARDAIAVELGSHRGRHQALSAYLAVAYKR